MIEAWRCTGAGNDFLALVQPSTPPSSSLVRAWCRRGVSLGADGLFVLGRSDSELSVRHWNADGLPAALCVNGVRCAAQLAHRLGWGDRTTIATGAGPVRSQWVDETTAAVSVPLPTSPPTEADLGVLAPRAVRITVGVPHVVVLTSDLAACPIGTAGPLMRRHPELGPDGANVDFVDFRSSREIGIRTWERGVEGETLACGTGVLAAVAVGVAQGRLELPARAETHGGFWLEVTGRAQNGVIREWTLAGDARVLGKVEITPEAEWVAPPSSWTS